MAGFMDYVNQLAQSATNAADSYITNLNKPAAPQPIPPTTAPQPTAISSHFFGVPTALLAIGALAVIFVLK